MFWQGWQDSDLRVTGSRPDALPLGYIPVFHNIGGGTVAVTLHHAKALLSWPASPRHFLTFGLGYRSLRRYHGTFQPCARTGRIRFLSGPEPASSSSPAVVVRRRAGKPVFTPSLVMDALYR